MNKDLRLQRLLDAIVPVLQPEAVYLFGSQARGDADDGSDYDLFLVMPDDAERSQLDPGTAYQLAAKTGIAADLVPCTRSRFNYLRDTIGSLSYMIAREGKPVYVRV